MPFCQFLGSGLIVRASAVPARAARAAMRAAERRTIESFNTAATAPVAANGHPHGRNARVRPCTCKVRGRMSLVSRHPDLEPRLAGRRDDVAQGQRARLL